MADKVVLWEFRYRSPLAPTKGVDTVLVQTDSDDYKQAEEVANDWLARERAHPSSRFVYIRPAVVATREAMLKRKEAERIAGLQQSKDDAPAQKQAVGGRVGA